MNRNIMNRSILSGGVLKWLGLPRYLSPSQPELESVTAESAMPPPRSAGNAGDADSASTARPRSLHATTTLAFLFDLHLWRVRDATRTPGL